MCIHLYIYIYTHNVLLFCACIYTYINLYRYIHSYIHACIHIIYIHIYMQYNTHKCRHTCMHIHIYIYVYIYIYSKGIHTCLEENAAASAGLHIFRQIGPERHLVFALNEALPFKGPHHMIISDKQLVWMERHEAAASLNHAPMPFQERPFTWEGAGLLMPSCTAVVYTALHPHLLCCVCVSTRSFANFIPTAESDGLRPLLSLLAWPLSRPSA